MYHFWVDSLVVCKSHHTQLKEPILFPSVIIS